MYSQRSAKHNANVFMCVCHASIIAIHNRKELSSKLMHKSESNLNSVVDGGFMPTVDVIATVCATLDHML